MNFYKVWKRRFQASPVYALRGYAGSHPTPTQTPAHHNPATFQPILGAFPKLLNLWQCDLW